LLNLVVQVFRVPAVTAAGRYRWLPVAGLLRAFGPRRIAQTLFVGHLPDDERPILDLLTDDLELGEALLFGSFACGFHVRYPW